MGNKLQCARSEHPEDWHMHHHFRDDSSSRMTTPQGTFTGGGGVKIGIANFQQALENKPVDSDSNSSEPEGEEGSLKSLKIDTLVEQLGCFITKIENVEEDASQRLAAAEKEYAALEAKLESKEKECASKDEENAKLLGQLSLQKHDNKVLIQEKEQLTQGLADTEERASAEEERRKRGVEGAKTRYEALQKEFESRRSFLETQLHELRATLKSEADRVSQVEQENTQLKLAASSLNEQITAIEAASSSRAADSAKVMELLEKQEECKQKLMLEKQEALDRVTAQEAKLQESVPLEVYQILKTQFQAVQQDFEMHKVDTGSKSDTLFEAAEDKIRKYQSQLQIEVQHVAAVQKERDELSHTVSALNEQITAMQAAITARADSDSNVVKQLEKQSQDILNMVGEKQGIVAQLSAQDAVPFDEHQALQKLNQATQQELEAYKLRTSEKIEALEAALAEQTEKATAKGAKLETVEKERNDLSESVSALDEQIAVLQTSSLSWSEDRAKVLEFLASLEKRNEELLKEKQQLLGQLAQVDATPTDTVPLEDHEIMKRQYQSVQKELESYKQKSDEQVSGLQKSNEELRSEVKGLLKVQKERDEFSDRISLLNKKLLAMQSLRGDEAAENAKALERLGAQYADIHDLVKEKQKKLTKLAAKDTVPFEFYDSCKKEYRALQTEFESYKLTATTQICSLETARQTEVSKCEAALSSDFQRLRALEAERNDLSDTISTLNSQMNAMRLTSNAQASENAQVLETLAKQYRDLFQVLEDKKRALAGAVVAETRNQDGDACSKMALLKNKQLVKELDALQESRRALQEEHEKQNREYQAKLGSDASRLASLEKERDELSTSVSSLNDKIASAQRDSTSSAEANAKLREALTEQKLAFEAAQQELETYKADTSLGPNSFVQLGRVCSDSASAVEPLRGNRSAPKLHMPSQMPSVQSLTRAIETAARERRMASPPASRATSTSSKTSRTAGTSFTGTSRSNSISVRTDSRGGSFTAPSTPRRRQGVL